MSDDGFDGPEHAAMLGLPMKYCRVVASRVNGDDAYVLLNTGSSEQPYLFNRERHQIRSRRQYDHRRCKSNR